MSRAAICVAMWMALICSADARAQEAAAPKSLREMIDASVKQVEIFDSLESTQPAEPLVALRWANNARGSEDGVIECAVRWLRGDRIGLEFAHETRLDCSAGERAKVLRAVIAKSFPDVEIETPVSEAVAAPPSGDEHRRERRHPLIWSGTIHYDFQSTPCRLRNLSETGAMIECSAPLRVGAEPMLELGEAVQLDSTVAWVAGDTAGLRFGKPFDLTELAGARPEVASARWNAPSYLKPGIAASDSPWEEQWDRMSIGELRQSLEGYLKR